jgi:hypothetical protein
VILVKVVRDTIDPAALARLDEWSHRARRATQTTIEKHRNGEAYKLDPKIWADHKEWLFVHVFNGKCAYCEGDVVPQSYGDAEHFRPKGQVTVMAEDGPVEVADENGDVHPGYYWLAYDPANLVPACQMCNSGTGKEPGKGTQFPAERHLFAPPDPPMSVEELDAHERPKILNPMGGEDPAKHIRFNEFGQPVSKTDIGRVSIEVFNLKRGGLNAARQELHDELHDFVREAIAKQYLGGPQAIVTLRKRMNAKRKPYLAATRDYVRKWWPIVRDEASEAP